MKRAVFLDKDGTILKNVPYNVDVSVVEFLPGVIDSLKTLQSAGYKLFVVSNQTGIAKGLFTETQFKKVITHIKKTLRKEGVQLEDFYYCPHDAYGKIPKYTKFCICHKPQPGMFKIAEQQHDIDLKKSWMIGDILHDVEAGKRAGCKTILLDNGNETEWHINKLRIPTYTSDNFIDAAQFILLHDVFNKSKELAYEAKVQ